MTRTSPPLKQHLLTRSDLARMAVPTGEVLAWLGSVALEQVGSLPGDGAADPVFTVLTAELRADLATRLAAIGKPDVVLTPERIRSFLTRVLHEAAPGTSAATGSEGIELKQLLQEAAAAGGDGDAVSRIAAAEAEGEAVEPIESVAPVAAADEPEPEAAADPTNGEEMDGATADALAELDALDTCFDLADLEAVVGDTAEPVADAVAEEPSPAPVDPEPIAPLEESALLDEPAPIEVEHVSDDAAAQRGEDEPAPDETSWGAAPEAIAEMAPPAASTVPDTGGTEPAPATDLAAVALAAEAALGSGDGDGSAPIQRVEAFLGLLKDAVIELAQRPAPQQFDMRPFVLAMQAGLDRSTQQAEVTATALETLHARVDGLGERLDVAVQPVAAMAPLAIPRASAAVAAGGEADAVPTLMAGLAVLALAWAVLFWLALDAPRLATGTLVGANVVGCLLLSTWWRR